MPVGEATIQLTPKGKKLVENDYQGKTGPNMAVLHALFEIGDMDMEGLVEATHLPIRKVDQVVTHLESKGMLVAIRG